MIKRGEIDFHAHILPGVDHGSGSTKTSRKQLDMAKAAGIKKICATSHFYPHMEPLESFLEKRQASYERLKTILKPDDPQIILGAEVLVCDGMESMPGLKKLCIEGTDMLLLEMPFLKWSKGVVETTECLCMAEGIKVVIAHADRYPVSGINWFIDNGIDLQLNLDAFNSAFKDF